MHERLRSGFLDQIKGPRSAHLLGDNDIVYTQYVPITPHAGTSFCLEIIPLPMTNGTPLIVLGNDAGAPILEYLSIIQ